MRINPVPVLLTLSTLLSSSTAYWKGFNLKSNVADGAACKTSADWATTIAKLQSFPNKINSVRVYTSAGCSTLANLVPIAIKYDIKILVGINPESNYAAEKGALLAAINRHGWGWIAAVSVGSEDLYRGSTTAATLAQQIYDVRGMLSTTPGYSKSIPVGHVDTSNAWSNLSNKAVIAACEFVGTDIYPYFQSTQNNAIENAHALYLDGVKQVRKAVAGAGSKAAVWVTETGWPIEGPTKNLAVPSVANARKYWQAVACDAFNTVNTFWFTLQDWSAVPSFGVIGKDSEMLYNQDC